MISGGRPASELRGAARRLLRAICVAMLSVVMLVQPAAAQSLLRDAETEALLADIARPIIAAAGPSVSGTRVVLLQDKEINAFVAGGQIIYIHSGLLTAADNVNQVQGVIAHELGHIVGGHVINFDAGAKASTGISIISLLLGAAAMAAGAGEAGMGVMAAGQQAAQAKFLAFSRTQESSADAAGVHFLRDAHLSGRGSIEFFNKLRKEEYRLTPAVGEIDPYAQTHPLSADRAATLEGDYKASPWWNAKTDPKLEARFARIKGKLSGFVDEPQVTFRRYPDSDQSPAALYARAYAWHKKAYPDKAVAEANKLIALFPNDPYILELKGQVLLESGQPAAAIAPLRTAVAQTNGTPLIATLLGHALVATEDPKNIAEARAVLRGAVARDNDNPFAWYELGTVYAQEGDEARASLATAERYALEGRNMLALGSADRALRGLPEGTADWLRAQDIAITSRTAAAQDKKKR